MVRVVPLAEAMSEPSSRNPAMTLLSEVRAANAFFTVTALRDSSIVGSSDQAIVRDFFPLQGTTAVATNGVQDGIIYGNTTAELHGRSHSYGIDSSAITANSTTIWNAVIDSQQLATDQTWSCFGFWDLTPSPDLVAMRWSRGVDVLDLWHAEQCYVFGADAPVGGIIRGALLYEPNDTIKTEMAFRTSANKNVGLFAYMAERAGDTLSK